MSTNDETKSVVLSWDLPHPPSKVWRAMPDSTLLARWLMDNDMEPRVGHRYTWQSSGFSTLDTVVTWTLDGTPDGGTRLTLEHTGFLAQNRREAAGARQGWGPRVRKLDSLLAGTA